VCQFPTRMLSLCHSMFHFSIKSDHFYFIYIPYKEIKERITLQPFCAHSAEIVSRKCIKYSREEHFINFSVTTMPYTAPIATPCLRSCDFFLSLTCSEFSVCKSQLFSFHLASLGLLTISSLMGKTDLSFKDMFKHNLYICQYWSILKVICTYSCDKICE
jgi:hypothetical protein